MSEKGNLYDSVKKNSRYGFYELKDEFRKQMKDFYENEYYQEKHATYQKTYDEYDIKYKNFGYAQKLFMYEKWNRNTPNMHSFLDIGAGEGFALAYFAKQGWDVAGIDYSSYGMEVHNPAMLENLFKGDFYEVIKLLEDDGRKFDLINADFVLEHLPDPELFFENIKHVSHEGTIVVITVPNDFSRIQNLAYDMGKIDEPFWVSSEDSAHMNYFSEKSLSLLGKSYGFEKIAALGDWPIDFFLLHDGTNYRKNSVVGHDCHVACVELENSLYEESMEMAVNLFQALAEAGIGRQVSVYYKMSC